MSAPATPDLREAVARNAAICLRRRRADLGLSLQDVATAAGLTKAHVWSLETDRQANPTLRAIVGLASALRVSVSEFLGLEDVPLASVTRERDAREFAVRSEAPGNVWDLVRHLEEQCRIFVRERDEWKAVANADRDKLASVMRERDEAREERDALLEAANFRPGPLQPDLSREVILDDIAGMRPAMVKAREAERRAQCDADLWTMRMLEEWPGDTLLIRLWRQRKEAVKRALAAEAELATLKEERDTAISKYQHAERAFVDAINELAEKDAETTTLKAAASRDGEAARQEIERLRAALRFYADPADWSGRPWKLYFDSPGRDGDGFEVARAALTTTETRDA